MENLLVYTDGACLGNPGPGGWGVRILYPENTVQERGGAAPHTTNNRMELQAAIAALETLQTASRATLFTDSRYVIDGLTRWLAGWRERNWMTTAETPVKNQDLWERLDALQHAGITWRHVRGHRGHPQNERVDHIARAFALGQSPTLFCGPAGAPGDPVALNAPPPAVPPAHAAVASQSTAQVLGYVSLVGGAIILDTNWPACAARVHKVAGAHYRKIRTLQELHAFCINHGMALPPEA